MTYYLLPGQDPVIVIRINIIDDRIQEGDEQFSVELRDYDISTVLINPIAEVIIVDDETTGMNSCLQIPVSLDYVFLLVIDNCTVALDRPIAVTATSAYYSFHGVGTGIRGFICTLDGVQLPDCRFTIKCSLNV